MRKFVATGLVSAAVISGCGEAAKTQPAQPLDQYQSDIAYIVNGLTAEQSPAAHFNGVRPDKYQKLASTTLKIAGAQHLVETYSDAGPSAVSRISKNTQYYAWVQQRMGEVVEKFAHKYHGLDIPLHDQQDRVTGKVVTSMSLSSVPSLLVLPKTTELTTDNSEREGATPSTTYTPDQYPRLKDAVSFVGPDSNLYRYSYSLATQACNALVKVRTQSQTYNQSAEGVVCSSFGNAFGGVAAGQTYATYARLTRATRNVESTPDGHNLKFFILPQKAYDEISFGQAPLALEGLAEAGSLKAPSNSPNSTPHSQPPRLVSPSAPLI